MTTEPETQQRTQSPDFVYRGPDRRRRPTPRFSRYTLWGGRRQEFRRGEEREGSFVDVYGRRLFLLVLWIALIVNANGLPHAQSMAAHAEALGLRYLLLDVPDDIKNSPLLADLRRSDHAAFWAVDYPAMMITDTSEFRYEQYHCATGEDAVELPRKLDRLHLNQ